MSHALCVGYFSLSSHRYDVVYIADRNGDICAIKFWDGLHVNKNLTIDTCYIQSDFAGIYVCQFFNLIYFP